LERFGEKAATPGVSLVHALAVDAKRQTATPPEVDNGKKRIQEVS